MDPAVDFAYFISYLCPYINQLTGLNLLYHDRLDVT